MTNQEIVRDVRLSKEGYLTSFPILLTGVVGEEVRADFFVGRTPHLVRILDSRRSIYQRLPCLLDSLLKYGRSVTLCLYGTGWNNTVRRYVETKTDGTNIAVEFINNA